MRSVDRSTSLICIVILRANFKQLHRYTNVELNDMHFKHRSVLGNKMPAQRMYVEWFLGRNLPDRQISERLLRTLFAEIYASRHDMGIWKISQNSCSGWSNIIYSKGIYLQVRTHKMHIVKLRISITMRVAWNSCGNDDSSQQNPFISWSQQDTMYDVYL